MLLLPLKDNQGHLHGRELFRALTGDVTKRFAGLTAHTRAPAGARRGRPPPVPAEMRSGSLLDGPEGSERTDGLDRETIGRGVRAGHHRGWSGEETGARRWDGVPDLPRLAAQGAVGDRPVGKEAEPVNGL